MFTALFESWDSWLPVVGVGGLLAGYLLLALFLFTLGEAFEKVRPEFRLMRPGHVWLNLIPIFNLAWIFITVSRLADSIAADLRDRDPHYDGDGGKTLGFLYATSAVLTAVPPLGVVTGLPCLAFTLLYWSKVVRLSKELDTAGDGVFWQKYNNRLEFPNSMALATLLITTMFALVVGTWALAAMGSDKKPVPIRLVEGGDDDSGEGSPGSDGGSAPTPLALGAAPDKANVEQLPLPKDLPVIQDVRDRVALDDPNAVSAVPDEKLAPYATLNDELQRKLLQLGQKSGTGPGSGKGDDAGGSGPGGIGADSTRARSLRWVLMFKTTSGRDYLNQLKAMNAVVVVPLGSDKSSAYVFYPKDLDNPRPDKLVSEAEWKALAQQIQFCDYKKDSAQAVGEALGLNFTPVAFWAFFPPGLEKELAKKEIAYRNRRPEDVAETKFQVQVRGGQYELVVVEQRAKR